MMASSKEAASRLTEIIDLLRPERPRKWPESLTAAAMDGDLERMQLFLDQGADIEQRSMFCSPLGAACSRGQLESVRWLIAHGAQLDPPDAQTSPIDSALGKVNCEIAAALLDAGLNVDRAAWGVIAGASLGRLDMIQWVIARGVELDRTYPRLGVLRERALTAAEKEKKTDVVAFLRGELDPGPAPSAPPMPRVQPNRSIAAASERPKLLAEALELVRISGKAAGKWNATGPSAPSQRMSITAHAAGNGVAEIVEALCNAGAPLNFENDGSPPPLHQAAIEAQLDVVRILLARGALPNGADGKTWLPLEAAVLSGEPQVVRALLDAGAKPKAKAASGGSLGERARGPYAAEIRAMLEEAITSRSEAKKRKK
jgi:ankyrin repeat protein